MLRIRLHGRGGQGIKTASQIVGDAAFYSDFQAQDFPLYGPERRGAPIVASARIDHDMILERGAIIHPDFLMVGDETLMEDQLANPLNGIDEFTNIFINSRHTPEELKAHYDLPSLPIAVNLTDACMRHLGPGAILSVALAAAVCRMTMKIRFGPLLKSVRLELEELGIGRKMIVKNFNLAREIFKAVTPRLLPSRIEEEVLQPSELIEMELKPAVEGAPVILSTGNMGIKKTGNWRVHRPEINYDACNGCLICFIRCPDGVIGLMDDVKPAIDYDHCKGCLICVEECPTHCIEVLREEPSWT